MSDKYPKPSNVGSSIKPARNDIHVHMESDTPAARAYMLSNGDVFTVKGKDREYELEFENGLLYEVTSMLDDQSNQFSYNNGQFIQIKWERTGTLFTPEEMNGLIST
jgi:hypothetical protein